MTLQTQIRIYYFTCDNKVQELGWMGSNWSAGATLGDVDPSSSTSLYAAVRTHNSGLAELRVGYQSPSHPHTITESFWIPSENRWGVREYPAMM